MDPLSRMQRARQARSQTASELHIAEILVPGDIGARGYWCTGDSVTLASGDKKNPSAPAVAVPLRMDFKSAECLVVLSTRASC